jgi:hypothetical protein
MMNSIYQWVGLRKTSMMKFISNLAELKRSTRTKLGMFSIVQLIQSYMLSLLTSPVTSTKDLSHLIMKSFPSRWSKYPVLIPLLVFAVHAPKSRIILLIFVVSFVVLDKLEGGWDKDEEEEVSWSSLSIEVVSILLSKDSYFLKLVWYPFWG